MTRRGPARPDLPGDDAPSAEVLDELLRAFAADTTDRARLERIDLTSPEVDELLGATPSPDPQPEPAHAKIADDSPPPAPPGPESSDRSPAADQWKATGAAEPEAAPAAPAGSAGPPVEPAPDEEGGAEAEPQPAGEAATEAEHDRGDKGGDGDPSDEADAPPDDPSGGTADHEPADDAPADGEPAQQGSPAEVGVVGDPFLGGRPAPESDPAPEPAGPRTISILDEGIPDSVYLGGNLEPMDTNRATVVIDDHDPGTGVTISVEDASSATKIEPRLRERRLAVKRAEGRKRLKWALLGTAVVLVIVAALAVLGSGLFAIDEVRVQGAERTDPAALADVIGDLEGTPVLRADTGAAERALERLPWVEDARVTTQFPDAATIELRERTPAAAFQGADAQWRLVDDQGRVLEIVAEQPVGYLPIRGDGFPDVEPGQYGPKGLAGAASLARSLTPAVHARAAEISVTTNGSDLRLHFTDGMEVRFGAADDLVQKLVRLETKLNDLGEEHVNYLDVSTNEVGQG